MGDKKLFNLKTVFAAVFIVLTVGVFLFWCINCASFVAEKITKKEVKEVKWDETKEYPIANKTDKNSDNDKNEQGKRFGIQPIDNVSEKIKGIEALIKSIVESSDAYMPGVKVKKVWDKYVYGFEGNTSTNGTSYSETYARSVFIPLGNGCWGYIEGSGVPVDAKAQIIVDFANQQKKAGRDFVFLETTGKTVTIPKKYAEIYGDNFYRKYSAAMNYLKDNGVDCLSSTDIIDNSGIDRNELFFKTDHHWLPQTGLWMTKELGEKLNKEYGYNTDISKLDIENYDVTYCEYPFLGSIGAKTTEIYAEYEYLPILMPKYDTNLTVEIPEMGYKKTGKLQDTMYDYDILSDDVYVNKYHFYAFDNKKLITIKNNNLRNSKRILVIKYSMANCMTPYMSNMAEYIDIIDLRYFKGSLQSFIDKTNPDTIVVIYSASGFGNDDSAAEAAFNFMD